MKKLIVTLCIMLTLVGCGTNNEKEEKLQIVSSYSIITDMLNQVGGDLVDVHNLVPTGTDPHTYEPLPEDIKKTTDSDLMFFNGLNLEGGTNGWFFKLANTVKKDDKAIIDLSVGIEPMYLHEGTDSKDVMNPHAYLNVNNGIIMTNNIIKALSEKDPDHKESYEKQGAIYIERLVAIDKEYETQFGLLHDEDRVIVTSERAFQYMNAHYGMKEAFIWAIDTDETGTASQIKELTQMIKEENVKVLFVESNVDTRPMETIAKETNVPIFEKRVYSDEVGIPGSEVDTYEKLLNNNLNVFIEGIREHGDY